MEIKPTIISGWNTDFFDIPYLYNRRLGYWEILVGLLSPISEVKWNEYKKRYVINGVSCLDYLSLYKKFSFIQQSSYRLDYIGEVEVGVKKIEYTGTLNDLYENELQKVYRL